MGTGLIQPQLVYLWVRRSGGLSADTLACKGPLSRVLEGYAPFVPQHCRSTTPRMAEMYSSASHSTQTWSTNTMTWPHLSTSMVRKEGLLCLFHQPQ